MKFLKLAFIYIFCFFAVAWVCGYPFGEALKTIPETMVAASPNKVRLAPLPNGVNPFFILIVSFLLGSLIVIVSAALNQERQEALQRCLVGMVVLHSLFAGFQYAGLVSDLDKDFDMRGWHLVKVGNYFSGPQNPKILAEQIKIMVFPRTRLKLDFRSDLSFERDPNFYLLRSLSYHLYPIDIRNIRPGEFDGALLMGVADLASAVPSEYQYVFPLGRNDAIALKEGLDSRR